MTNVTHTASTKAPMRSPIFFQSLIDSVSDWLVSFRDLVVLEGKKAGIGLALILGFGVGATALLIVGWIALLGSVVAALVENDILGWIWSLLLVALLNFAGAGGLMFLAIKRSKNLLFSATRRQFVRKSVSTSSHE